ncbi:MAG: DUF4421 family protein [Oligoflexia bacterium]|nr:DUF4421 family protein [Oligoflexia bacterium]
MNMNKSFIVMGLCLCVTAAHAGSINHFSNKFITIRGYAEFPSYQLELKSQQTGKIVKWQPNLRSITGVDFSIHGLFGAGIGFQGPEAAETRESKGITDYIDYRFSFAFRRFHMALNYQQYKGFFIENSAEIDPTVQEPNHIKERNMTSGNASANLTFISNPESFSYMAALDQNARQESSGGSWLLGLSATDTHFSNDNFMIPAAVRNEFGNDSRIKVGHFYSLEAKGGYGYTVAWTQKWFTSAAVNLGLGGLWRVYSDDQTEYKSTGSSGKADALASFGFNGDDFLMTVVVTGDITTFTTRSIDIPRHLWSAKLLIGAHF